MTMNWILLNIPLGVVMVAIAAGLPAWVIWRFPEGDDSTTAQRVASRSREHSALTTRSTTDESRIRMTSPGILAHDSG